MRCIVALATLARQFTEFLFQPTDLLPTSSGLSELLRQQAAEDSKQEAALRAVLNRTLIGKQDEILANKCKELCDRTMQWLGILSPESERAVFRDEVRLIIDEACDIWRAVRHLEDLIFLSFENYLHSNGA